MHVLYENTVNSDALSWFVNKLILTGVWDRHYLMERAFGYCFLSRALGVDI